MDFASKMDFASGIALCLIAAVIWQIISTTRQALFTPLRKIPGPRLAGWTALPLRIKVVQGQRSQYIHELHKKYGPYVRIGPNEVCTSDLSSLKYIHRQGTNFHKSPWYQKISQTVGVFAESDPKKHMARRRLFAPYFTMTSLLRHEALVRDNFELALSKIERDGGVGKADIFKWFTFMATDTFGDLAFGKSFEMLRQEQKNPYIEDLEMTMKILGVKAELGPLFTLASALPIKQLRELSGLQDRLQSYGVTAIRNHRDYVALHGVEKSNFAFASFLDPKKTSELTERQLVGEASDLILAGADTSAVTSTYMIWAMLRPENSLVRARLVEIIQPIPLTAGFTELSQIKYLRNVVDEVLRLYGAAPTCLPRIVPPEGAVLGGYLLPGGATINTQAYTFHRDPTIYEDPERLNPDRWENPTEAMKDAFHPFGLGARTCLGMNLARLELTLGLFLFFKHCPDAMLALDTTDDSMDFVDFALISPKARRCNITFRADMANPIHGRSVS